MSPDQYKSLLKNNVEKEYKKAPTDAEHMINMEAKTDYLVLDDGVQKLAHRNSFVTLKDHKANFRNI